MKLCFVIPAFNERETLAPLVEGISEHAAPHPHSIYLVDDGSSDGTYEEMIAIRTKNPAVHVVRHRGNFGKSAALATGFALADGDIVFTMDSDLQDDPKEIPRFLAKLDEGFDVVCGWKARRHDPWHKVIPSFFYNAIVSRLFQLPIHDVNCGFKAFRVEVVKRIQVYGEMHRLIPVLAHNLNYRVGEIPVEHHPRRFGVSKYGFERFFRGAIDVLTIWFLSRYQHAPAHFFAKIGILQCLAALLCLIGAAVVGSRWQPEAAIIALCAVAVMLGLAGLILIGLGLLAELVLRHFVRIDPALYSTQEESGE